MSEGYEDEQKKLKASVTELTPEIMHELIEKIAIHAPYKSRGHLTQQIDIYYRFDVAVSTAVADGMKYDKKRKAAQPHRLRSLILKTQILLYRHTSER